MAATQTVQPYKEDIFDASNRKRCAKYVLSMQRRLDKAVANGEKGKIRYISYLLTRRSKAVRILATQRVTDNSGCHTAGVDGVSIPKGIGTYEKNQLKVELMKQIDVRKKPEATRRTYIPKPHSFSSRFEYIWSIASLCSRLSQSLRASVSYTLIPNLTITCLVTLMSL